MLLTLKLALTSVLLTVSGLVLSLAGALTPTVNHNLGASNFLPVQTQKATLSAAGIGTSDTSITLTSFKLPDGATLVTMSNFGTIGYGTLEPGTSKEESISFTGITQNANGSATLTGVTRGLRFVYPYDSVSANKLTHAGGTTFVISNTSAFYSQFVAKNSDGTISQTLTFSSTTPPQYDGNTIASGNQFVSFAQLNATAIQGGATSTEANLGLVQLATKSQQAGSTASSTAGAPLVLTSREADASYDGTKSNQTVITDGTNHIDSNYISTSSPYTWSGTNNFTANLGVGTSTPIKKLSVNGDTWVTGTTTMASLNVASSSVILNGVQYQLPSSQGSATSTLVNNGSGNISWVTQNNWGVGSTTPQGITYTGVFNHTLGRIPKIARIRAQGFVANNAGTGMMYAESNGIATSTVSTEQSYVATVLGQSGGADFINPTASAGYGRSAYLRNDSGAKFSFYVSDWTSTTITIVIDTNANIGSHEGVRSFFIDLQ